MLIGHVLHPGGLELTGYLGTALGLNSADKDNLFEDTDCQFVEQCTN